MDRDIFKLNQFFFLHLFLIKVNLLTFATMLPSVYMLSASADIVILHLSGFTFLPHFLQDASSSFVEILNFSKIAEINVASSADLVSIDIYIFGRRKKYAEWNRVNPSQILERC